MPGTPRNLIVLASFTLASAVAVAQSFAQEAGAPGFGPAITLGTTIVGTEEHFTEAPQLVGDTAGRWIASWVDRVLWDGNDVLGTESASSDNDGRSWSPPQLLHATDYPAAASNSLAGDGSGVVIDGWSNRSGTAVRFRRSVDGGQTWSDAEALYQSEHPDEYDWHHDISELTIASGRNHRWIAVWSESVWYEGPCPPDDDGCIDYEGVGVLCGVRAAVSSDNGISWSDPQTIRDACYGAGVEVAGDGNGGWLAAWGESPSYDPMQYIRGTFSPDDGEHWSEPQTLLADMERRERLSIASSGTGGWLMAFAQWHFDPLLQWPESLYRRIHVSHADDPLGTWSEPSPVAPWHETTGGDDRYPSVAAAEDGGFGLAWSSDTGGSRPDADIVASFSDDGTTWSTPIDVDSEAGSNSSPDIGPRLVRVGPDWVVVWRDLDQPRSIRFARTRGNCGDGDVDVNETCDDANLVEGDGCDSTCLVTGCGSVVVTAPEQCDDGNLDDTDACVACSNATCGDGAVQAGVEQCDDANDVETDGCPGTCMIARCGDAAVLAGVEECDDGDTSGNNDACLNECTPAQCGDGYIQLREEECDDGNSVEGDGCSSACRMDPDCGLLNRSGLRVTSSDALKLLRRAVGHSVACPLRDCDLNADGKVAAIDALLALRSAVGLFAEGCSWPGSLVLRLDSAEKLGILRVIVSYADAAGHIVPKPNGKADCTFLVPTATEAIDWNAEAGTFWVGFTSIQGYQGSLDLLRCKFDPVSGPSLRDFHVVVEGAWTTGNDPVAPLPAVSVVAE